MPAPAGRPVPNLGAIPLPAGAFSRRLLPSGEGGEDSTAGGQVTRDIPSELREFLASKFGSPEQVDVFLLLHRRAERGWTPAEVGAELGMAPQSAGMRLFLLASSGLLAAEGDAEAVYRYVADPALDALAALLAEAYAEQRQELYAVVTNAPRPDPARQFADAFKLKKP